MPEPADLDVRRMRDGELDAVIALAGQALGWAPGEPNGDLFRWKHLDNPFGSSPMWVAVDGERLAGFRTFLRWGFVDGAGRHQQTVRAVDTATHPDFQGRGVFTRLTMAALDEMRDEGIHFVFNTPNDKSRPGYLKMGWQVLGRVPISARPAGLRSLAKMRGARAAAGKWSLPADAGEDPAKVFADTCGIASLLLDQPPRSGLTTDRSPAFLLWRYRLAPLAYRVVLAGSSPSDGLAVFRRRRRGTAVEATVCDVLVPGADPARRRALLRTVARVAGADYAVMGGPPASTSGYVPVPGLGPILTFRAVNRASCPPLGAWHLTLGDVELF